MVTWEPAGSSQTICAHTDAGPEVGAGSNTLPGGSRSQYCVTVAVLPPVTRMGGRLNVNDCGDLGRRVLQ